MEHRDTARALAWMRIGLATGGFLAPRWLAGAWTGDTAPSALTKMAVRGLCARDGAIGLGLLLAIERGAPVRGWLEAAALADLGDALATVTEVRSLPWWRSVGLLAIEGGAAAVEFRLAGSLE